MKILVAVLLSFAFVAPAVADDYTLEPLNEAPPSELAAPIRSELVTTALRLKRGSETVCDIWLRKAVPTTSGQGIGRSYPNMPDTTLLGAVRVVAQMRDNRDHTFPTGLYTMRHGIQPQDGNHAGSTPFIDFALLLSAKTDTTLDGGFPNPRAMLERSMSDGGAGHPVVFALLPSSGSSATTLKKNSEEKWIIETRVGELPIALVIVGVYEH